MFKPVQKKGVKKFVTEEKLEELRRKGAAKKANNLKPKVERSTEKYFTTSSTKSINITVSTTANTTTTNSTTISTTIIFTTTTTLYTTTEITSKLTIWPKIKIKSIIVYKTYRFSDNKMVPQYSF